MAYNDIFFILALLPLSVIISFFDNSAEYKNLISIITGIIFIAWGRPIGVLVVCLFFLFDWLIALLIGKVKVSSRAGASALLVLDLLFNISIFIVYTRGNVIPLPGKLTLKSTLIPFAMGYYVLRAFSYVYDVYKGEEAEKNPLYLLTYFTSAQFMMCGPVIRYKDIKPQLHSRRADGRMISGGFDLIVYGLAKVMIIASALNKASSAGLEASDVSFFGCWLGMAAYFGAAYFTLSGFCEISRGFGLMNGFVFSENFAPIDSKAGFTGLVRGYNTTVTHFFEEALYSPFAGKKALSAAMAFVCCIAVAAWYSFSKPVLLAGALAGAVVVLELLLLRERISKLPAAVRYLYLIILSMLIFGICRFGTVYGWRRWALGLVGVGDKYLISKQLKTVIMNNLFVFISGLIIVISPLKSFLARRGELWQASSGRAYSFIEGVKTVFKAILLVMCISSMVIAGL